MFSNKLAFTVLGAACIAAAGAGSYIALRQNATSSAKPIQAVITLPSSAATAAFNRPVQETEAIVSRTPSPKVGSGVASDRTAPAEESAAARRETKPAQVHAARPESTSPVERSAGNGVPTPVIQAAQTDPVAVQPVRPLETVERVAPEPALLPDPPQKSYDELVVSADSVIGLQSETTVTSERARVEDKVEARVTRDVRVGNRVAIPAGSRALGFVSQVERGGKFKEHARIAVRFQTVVLPDGTRVPISTDAVIREGAAPGNDTAKKMGGGAVAGTILGAIIGGGKGAAIGGMAGAGAGAGMVAAGDRSAATLHAGEPMTIRLLAPVMVVADR
jgi:urease beta subunit